MDYYSAIKKNIWVSPNEVDEPKACYTEWSKSEREKQIPYINTYIWNLERWYWWAYLQGSSRDADRENKLVASVGEDGMTWESSMETYQLPYVKWIASGNLFYDSGNSNQGSVRT